MEWGRRAYGGDVVEHGRMPAEGRGLDLRIVGRLVEVCQREEGRRTELMKWMQAKYM